MTIEHLFRLASRFFFNYLNLGGHFYNSQIYFMPTDFYFGCGSCNSSQTIPKSCIVFL